MKKILYIATQSEIGGAQRYLFDLATNLPKSQWEVHVAAGGKGELSEWLKKEHIPFHKMRFLARAINPIVDILAYFEIKKLLLKLKPDIAHLNSSKAGTLGSLACQAAGIPKVIYTAHGFVFNEPLNPIIKWIYREIEMANAKRNSKTITVSEYDYKTGRAAGIPAKKLICIHNGIDVREQYFLAKEEARKKILKDVEMKKGQKLVGCIANFYGTKGLDTLIHAIGKIENAKLVIIGEGKNRYNLERLIKKLNIKSRVILAGSIPGASQYLKAFDLFVLASKKEGLPYTLLEAAGARVPIVATKVGGVPEIIDDGINGYLVPPNNPVQLAQVMQKAFVRPRTPILHDDFTLPTMLRKTIELYRS